MAVATILSPGANVGGKFEVVEIIGFGGMGVVYKVREQVGAVSRIRALKTVLPQFASDAVVARRFRQEAEKMCMLEHENIVPVLSYSEEGEFPYLVMPFIEGQTLKEYLAELLRRARARTAAVGGHGDRSRAGAGLGGRPSLRQPGDAAGRSRWSTATSSPATSWYGVENESGERRLKVLIMDFGIAKVLSDQDSGHSLTEVIGTVKYASPEQIRRGKDIDPRADIYSLGMVLYELYAGHHMFAGMTEHTVLMRMVQRDLKDLEIPFPEGTPERFRQLIQRCVAVDREPPLPERRRDAPGDAPHPGGGFGAHRDGGRPGARLGAVESGPEQWSAARSSSPRDRSRRAMSCSHRAMRRSPTIGRSRRFHRCAPRPRRSLAPRRRLWRAASATGCARPRRARRAARGRARRRRRATGAAVRGGGRRSDSGSGAGARSR